MTFFELLLALLFAAILLLQVSRRLSLPYPAMLALAGVAVAFIPGAPTIHVEPQTALALFIAPVLLDAAFDFPLATLHRLWRPLTALAVGAVLVTTAAVAWIGWAYAGLPIAAALVLGAIVSPPDAAATTAVLGTVTLPKRTLAVLKGESLFNDATALLLFSGALAVQGHGGLDSGVAWQLALAVPGGVIFGLVTGMVMLRVDRLVTGTLGGNILQFVAAFAVWVGAEHLHLSAVLAVVAFGMTLARAPSVVRSPRMRVHAFAVWATVVFLLNTLAFLLMGMQARTIVASMPADRLHEALGVTGFVVLAVVLARFAVVMAWNRLAARYKGMRGDLEPPSLRQGLFVSWSGMRGLLTMATAFALPEGFPERDVVVLSAFGVVLVTLVVQGLTLTPLIKLLKLHEVEDLDAERRDARDRLTAAGLAALERRGGREGALLRHRYDLERASHEGGEHEMAFGRYRRAGLAAVEAERQELEKLRDEYCIGDESYLKLQEEIDWRELTLLPEDERVIEES